ncbi:3D domain-containing protein (plasmid) [Sorangium sp. So ce119]|uniref:3D domain-containing protein n=1 Tax=Sorangium sp. So ce119 TaxID=3133279 RepID=UPI003F61D157
MTSAARAGALAVRGLHALLIALAAGCTAKAGADWVHDGSSEPRIARGGGGWLHAPASDDGGRDRGAGAAGDPQDRARARVAGAPGEAPGDRRGAAEADLGQDGPAILVREHGRPARAADAAQAVRATRATSTTPDSGPGLFRNTYYDFPTEGDGPKDAALYDAACAPLASVPRAFHDQVCVQGSGRLASGDTVSFARRGCACADVCPRTGQQVCFERLDPRRFPYGRGATGRPITPLRTVAVDSSVIPLGTSLYVPELVGLPLPGGGRHDGCFVAEDRGIKVVGRQIDVFTGDPAVTARLNALFPSNRGVRLVLNDARCRAVVAAPGPS